MTTPVECGSSYRNRSTSQLADILNPPSGGTEHANRKQGLRVDYSRNNKAAVRQASSQNRIQKEMDELEEPTNCKTSHLSRASISDRSDARSRQAVISRHDFILENAMDVAITLGLRTSCSLHRERSTVEPCWLTKEAYGSTPRYLQNYIMEMAKLQATEQIAREASSLVLWDAILAKSEARCIAVKPHRQSGILKALALEEKIRF